MKRSPQQLREDALAIWQAGVDAVRSDRLVRQWVRVDRGELRIGQQSVLLSEVGRILVVGAGKAGAGMAAGLETALGDDLMTAKQLTGWINVPADCVRPLRRIKLHAGRPAGVNEPTAAGVEGAEQILRLVQGLARRDLCLCLISGGGSALLPAPVPGISLADKQAITQHLSSAGANIQQLNTVRKQLSRIKGGGLARACAAGRLITLIISDVIGDPLDVIASGPTVEDSSTARMALEVLGAFGARRAGISPDVFAYLERAAERAGPAARPGCEVTNLVIGNNRSAVEAAGKEAQRRGYQPALSAACQLEGEAEEVGRQLADRALRMRAEPGPDCLISGGEPIVKLVPEPQRGWGGRNQQLVLAALVRLLENSRGRSGPLEGIVLLSGGTDGEDGPTDAAGAVIDCGAAHTLSKLHLQPAPFLRRNDAYHFFELLGALMKTGPTHTNVCDLRVVVVDRIENR